MCYFRKEKKVHIIIYKCVNSEKERLLNCIQMCYFRKRKFTLLYTNVLIQKKKDHLIVYKCVTSGKESSHNCIQMC